MPRVHASTVLTAPAEDVWASSSDFGAVAGWYSAVPECGSEDGKAGDQVGAIRSTHPADGAQRRERSRGG